MGDIDQLVASIFGFALAYFLIGNLPFLPGAFVFSLTSFHGRGFFPGLGNENSLHNPLVILAAFEAIIGLLIEISFIATFTQRFSGGDIVTSLPNGIGTGRPLPRCQAEY